MPALATPPQKKPATTTRKTVAPQDRHWADRLVRSGYFLGAVLFHLILFIIFATWVIFTPPPPPVSDFQKTYIPSAPPPPPPQTSTPTMPVPTHTAPSLPTIINQNAVAPVFNVPLPDITTATMDKTAPKINAPAIKAPNNLNQRLPAIRHTESLWGRSSENILESNGDPHNVVAKFPVYLASYADGDWYCNVHLTPGGQIDAGSLPDLVAKINEWSRGKITGSVVPTPLAIGSPDLLAKMPPFIFFTGHKDFKLTDVEVENLRNYLQNGGAVWGDNTLAGYGSRFDVAFRREMKRVIPDIDKNFEEVPLTHDIFTKSWFTIDKVPQGMNYYAEPLQHLDIDGKLAIIYTPNDYSDLFFMHILPGDAQMGPVEALPNDPLFTNRTFLWNSGIFFRNFTLPSALAAQQFGMNVLGFLLVRFDKDLLLAP
jgi:hypothetical protein